MRRRALGLCCGVLVAGVLTLIGCGGQQKAPEGAPPPAPTAPQKATPQKTVPKTTPAETTVAMRQPAKLGDRTLTVNDVERSYAIPAAAPKAKAGMEFVRVNVSVENTSSSPITLNPTEFKLQDSSGVQRNWTAVSQLPNAIASSSIAPGGTATGNVVFEAPQADPGLKLVYTPIGPRRESVTVDLQG